MKECNSNEKCGCCCHSQEEGGHHHHEEKHEDFISSLLEVADHAWMGVLEDKIKEHILATQNDRMTELAKTVSEANSQRWKHKMEKKHGRMDFKEKLGRFFGGSKK